MDKSITSNNDITRFKRLWMAIILGSFSAIAPLSMDMYLPALPELGKDIGSSASLVQLSLTACLLGMAIGQVVIGAISDKRGRRIPLIISLVVYCLASLLCAFAPTIEILLFLRLLQGISGAGGIVISRAIVRDLFSGPDLTRFFALLMLVNGAAPILAPVIGGGVLQFTSWRGVFILLCVLSIFMLGGAIFGLKETLTPQNRSEGGIKVTIQTFRNLFTDRSFMGYALTQGFVMAAMFAYISGSPFVVQNIYGASPQMFSLVFAINGVGIMIATQVTGRLAGRIEEIKLLRFGLAIAALGGLLLLVMIFFDAKLIGVMIGLFFVVSSVGIVGTTCFSLAMENQKKAAGSAAALLGLLPLLLGSIMAPLVGLAGENTAVPMGVIIISCHLIAIVSYMLLARTSKIEKVNTLNV